MAAINDFRAYFQRKYMINGQVKTEEERECAIFPKLNNKTQDNLFTIYTQNEPIYGGYSGSFTGIAGGYCSYDPGLIYVPKLCWTGKDAIPNGYFDDLPESLEIGSLREYLKRQINQMFLHQQDKTYATAHISPNNRFIYDVENNIQGVFTIYVRRLSKNNGVLREATIDIHIALEFFPISTDLTKLTFGSPSGIPWETTVIGWFYNGELIQSDDYYLINNERGQIFNIRTYGNQNHCYDAIDRAVEIFNGIKFTFTLQLGTRSVNYMRFYNGLSAGQTNPTNLYILVDVTNSPHFPTAGFYVEPDSQSNIKVYAPYVRIDWSGGPKPNNPSEKDDPNVEDPGYGPGQDPNDKGGNGNHDNSSDNIKPPGIPTLSASGVGLISIFNPTISEITALGQSLWNPTALEAIKQYFTNPLDCILGLSIIPVKPKTGSSREILLGLYKSGVTSALVDSDYVIVNCGSVPIDRYYGSYLDYSPYTKIKCILPYIGEVDINPDEVMQTSLMILYYVNVVTGDVVAMLCANENIIYSVAGNCIRQLPLSSTDYSGIINTAVSAVTGVAMAVATGGVSSAAMGAASAAKGATEASKNLAAHRAAASNVGSASSLIGDVMNAKANYQHAGSIGTGSGQMGYQKPYLIIERPNLDLADNYKSFVGYPCNETKQISHCSGFTQIEASNISVPNATDTELAEIKELLMRGVII